MSCMYSVNPEHKFSTGQGSVVSAGLSGGGFPPYNAVVSGLGPSNY